MLPDPINIPKWLEKHGDLLKPPVNNFCLHRGGFTVMIIGGPNERTDYHINTTPEWFYQYKGGITLKVVDEGKFRDIEIGEQESFLLPANTPHSPVRYQDTIGIVVEQDRPNGVNDKMRWYCSKCKAQLYEGKFRCDDLGSQVKDTIDKFDSDINARTCKKCGHVNKSRPE
ncbi:3-hydroxyanthranilic acid dioxygenase [Brettanomyces bruxellensis]|nr:3-hydroxyanthranilic acid dioxygenase [Brettanomyces bruxellensis]